MHRVNYHVVIVVVLVIVSNKFVWIRNCNNDNNMSIQQHCLSRLLNKTVAIKFDPPMCAKAYVRARLAQCSSKLRANEVDTWSKTHVHNYKFRSSCAQNMCCNVYATRYRAIATIHSKSESESEGKMWTNASSTQVSGRVRPSLPLWSNQDNWRNKGAHNQHGHHS